MRFMHHAAPAALALAIVALASQPAKAAEADARAACDALAQRSTAAFRVDTAEWVAAGNLPGPAANPVPAHCLFRVTLDPRDSDIEDVSFGTGIELRLPLAWNGRLLVQGGGGLNGVLTPALG